jgi:hypothetical protein
VSTCRIYKSVTSAVRPFWQSSISSAKCQSTPPENNFFRCARRSGSRPLTNQQPSSKVKIGNAPRSTKLRNVESARAKLIDVVNENALLIAAEG